MSCSIHRRLGCTLLPKCRQEARSRQRSESPDLSPVFETGVAAVYESPSDTSSSSSSDNSSSSSCD